MSELNGVLITTPEVGTLPQAQSPEQVILFDPTRPMKLSWASWDRSTEEGYLLLSSVKSGDKKPLADMVKEVIEVENVYIQPATGVNKDTGEVKVYPWIVLIGPGGEMYTCGSHGVFGSLVDALLYRKAMPWKPPMRFMVRSRNLKNGHRTLELQGLASKPAIPPAPEGKRDGKK